MSVLSLFQHPLASPSFVPLSFSILLRLSPTQRHSYLCPCCYHCKHPHHHILTFSLFGSMPYRHDMAFSQHTIYLRTGRWTGFLFACYGCITWLGWTRQQQHCTYLLPFLRTCCAETKGQHFLFAATTRCFSMRFEQTTHVLNKRHCLI